MSSSYKALNEYLLVEVVEKESEGYELDETGREVKKTESGIVLIRTEDSRPKRLHSIGKVLSAGRGKISGGTAVPNQCEEGDKICFYTDICVKLDLDESKELYLVKEEHVMAIVE